MRWQDPHGSEPFVHGLAPVVDAGGAPLLAVGERLKEIDELRVAALLDELATLNRPRWPHVLQTIESVG